MQIAIDVDCSENNKCCGKAKSQTEQRLPATLRLKQQDRPEHVAGSHNTNPWDERIERYENDVRRKLHRLTDMENHPQPAQRAERFRLDAIESIVTDNHRDADCGYCS